MVNFNFILANSSSYTGSFSVVPITYPTVPSINEIATGDIYTSSNSPLSVNLLPDTFKIEANLQNANNWYIGVDSGSNVSLLSGSNVGKTTVIFNLVNQQNVPLSNKKISIEPLYKNIMYSGSYVLSDTLYYTLDNSGSLTVDLVNVPYKITEFQLSGRNTTWKMYATGSSPQYASQCIIQSSGVSANITPVNNSLFSYTAAASDARYLGISGSVTSASYSLTSSYASNVPATSSYSLQSISSSYALTASYAIDISPAETASYAFYAETSSVSNSSSYSLTSSYALEALSSSYAISASNAPYQVSSSYALSSSWAPSNFNGSASYSDFAVTASYASNVPATASVALQSISSSYSLTASYASNVPATSSYSLQSISSSYLSGSTGVVTNFFVDTLNTTRIVQKDTSNILIGTQAGDLNVYSTNNVFIGDGAGAVPSVSVFNYADNSTFIGKNAGRNSNYGSKSNFIGTNAGLGAINAGESNFIGHSAGSGSVLGVNSNFFGYKAGSGATNAKNAIFIGNESGLGDMVNNDTGNKASILIGNSTSTGGHSDSICIGTSTTSPTSQSLNIGNLLYATGIHSGSVGSSTSASVIGGKVGIGTNSPQNTLDVIGNISASSFTGSLDGTASYAISASYAPSNFNGSASYSDFAVTASYASNVSLTSSYALEALSASYAPSNFNGSASYSDYSVTSSYVTGSTSVINTLIVTGYIVNTGSTAPANSNFIGVNAGLNAISASNSVFIGLNAGSGSKFATNSTFINQSAGQLAVSASQSTFIGVNAGSKATVASGACFLGNAAGSGATRANDSCFIGKSAGANATDAPYSCFIGQSAGSAATNAHDSNFFGIAAGSSATNAYGSNFIGFNAGSSAAASKYSNFIGYYAASGMITSHTLNVIGYKAGSNEAGLVQGCITSNFMGNYAGNGTSYVTSSNFFGAYAGYASFTSSFSNFIGASAGYQATKCQRSNFFGVSAGRDATSASFSNFIGQNAGRGANWAENSTFIGQNAGSGSINTASNCLFIGQNAGATDSINNSGNHSSILIGDFTSTGGNRDSISIGKGTKNSAENQLNIGNVIYATGIESGSTPSSTPMYGKVGININAPVNTLDVAGNISASSFTGSISSSNIIGTVMSSSYALTASYLSGSIGIVETLTVTGLLNAQQISGSQVYITSSHLTVTSNILELNAQTPHLRYAGISVLDSGSTSQNANFLWDGLNNYFFLSSSAEVSYSRQIVTGPENEGELPVNVIPMAYAYNGLTSSIMSQSVNTIGISGNVIANSFTGSVQGTSSWSNNSLTSSYITASNIVGTVVSSSYSVTSSYATSLQLYDAGLGRFVTITSNNGILKAE